MRPSQTQMALKSSLLGLKKNTSNSLRRLNDLNELRDSIKSQSPSVKKHKFDQKLIRLRKHERHSSLNNLKEFSQIDESDSRLGGSHERTLEASRVLQKIQTEGDLVY